MFRLLDKFHLFPGIGNWDLGFGEEFAPASPNPKAQFPNPCLTITFIELLITPSRLKDQLLPAFVERFFQPDQFGHYDTPDTPVLFQSQRSLYPGKYRAIFALKEPDSGAIGTVSQEIEVPSYDESELSLSTVTLAYKLEPVIGAGDADAPTPLAFSAHVPEPTSMALLFGGLAMSLLGVRRRP